MQLHTRTIRERAGRAAAGMLTGALTVAVVISGTTRTEEQGSTAAGVSTVATVAAERAGTNPATPRNFTGYGFDQCLAPSQNAMDAWLRSSPFWAVGIYISGASRACRSQPNLTPPWVKTQLENGWRLLPITLGPQASCSTRFPRYSNDPTISSDSSSNYARARAMGRAEADDAVETAKALGIVPGSTLWYDLEAFDISKVSCRESALNFVSAWTTRLHRLDYVSGYYSSAASGIRMLDDARANRPGAFALPDRIWIADWNGSADVESRYIRPDGWMPRNRMKQYRGGHNETWGGVTINIDSNFLDLGRGSVPRGRATFCGGLSMDLTRWPTLRRGATGAAVERLQCLLQRQGFYDGSLTGAMDAPTRAAVRAMRIDRGIPSGVVAGERVWVSLHAAGRTSLIKYGAGSEMVRRLQRALNATHPGTAPVTGSFAGATATAVKGYQGALGLARTGVVTPELWQRLQAGRV